MGSHPGNSDGVYFQSRSRGSVPYYRPKPSEKKVQTSVYLPADVHEACEDLAKLWTAIDQVDDPEAKWKPADVMRRLIEAGSDGAWAEVGGRPTTEQEWVELLKKAPKVFQKK